MDITPFSYENLSFTDVLLDLGVRFILNCPREDVSTPSRLMFQVEEAHWFYEDFAREQNLSLPGFQLQSFTKELYRIFPVLSTFCGNYQTAYNEFKEYKKGIPVRGVIILNNKLDKVLMVRPYKRPHWGLPRGKINKEEDDRVCAVREVMEETGFDSTQYLDGNDYCERTVNGKNIRFYFASGVPESTVFETRTRKEIDEIKWIPISELKSGHSKRKFFLITMFVGPIEKHVRKKKGYTTKLSQLESDALKNLLGVSDGKNVHNDERTAQQLLTMLKPNGGQQDTPQAHTAAQPVTAPLVHDNHQKAVMQPLIAHQVAVDALISPEKASQESGLRSDKQVLLDLLKESRPTESRGNAVSKKQTEVESAKQILALLKQEIASENAAVNEPFTKPVVESRPAPSAPVLPPNSMLEQLVSSRKSNPVRKPALSSSGSGSYSQNRLLSVLNSNKDANPGSVRKLKLIDLLLPPKPEPRDSKNPLMDLLDSHKPSDASGINDSKELDDSTTSNHSDHIVFEKSDTKNESPNTKSSGSSSPSDNILLSLLQPTSKTTDESSATQNLIPINSKGGTESQSRQSSINVPNGPKHQLRSNLNPVTSLKNTVSKDSNFEPLISKTNSDDLPKMEKLLSFCKDITSEDNAMYQDEDVPLADKSTSVNTKSSAGEVTALNNSELLKPSTPKDSKSKILKATSISNKFKKTKESKDSRKSNGLRDSKNLKEYKDFKEPMGSNEVKELKDSGVSITSVKAFKGPKAVKEHIKPLPTSKKLTVSKNTKDFKKSKDDKDKKKLQQVNEPSCLNENRETSDFDVQKLLVGQTKPNITITSKEPYPTSTSESKDCRKDSDGSIADASNPLLALLNESKQVSQSTTSTSNRLPPTEGSSNTNQSLSLLSLLGR